MPIIKATHVLMYLPQSVTNDETDLWALRGNDVAPGEKFRGSYDDAFGYLPGDATADPYGLTTWAISHIGQLVHLGHRCEVRVKGRFVWHSVPFYYVFPGER